MAAALPIIAGESGLTRYLSEIKRFPMLEPQEEYMLAKRWREHGDREAAHKLCGTVAAFSTAVGAVASELEDQVARGQLEETRPLVEQLEAMARELIERLDGLSIEALRDQAGAAGDRERTASP